MDNNMIKRKRLDARSYREWHMANTKKHKGLSGSDPEQRNIMSQERDDKPEAGCSRKKNSESDSLQAQQPREDSDLKSQPGNGEATFEQYGCSVSDGFVEYWVPASFSHLQLEKYCETLIKHSHFLCSRTKKGNMDLQDVIMRVRECCDHPYLVDSSLECFLSEGRPMVDILTTGIEASGKLLLLDKFLQEAKGKGLKVLIVFQPNYSKSGSVELRHLLDDIMRRRFGEESYVHIYREFDRVKKRAACDLFNDNASGKFVMLMEKNSCQSNIKLSSVDFVILFNSDWCPINDMRCLRKMSIQSKGDHLKVLRLYTSNSVEEKVLTLAKKGSALDSSIHTFSHNVSHTLLLWGATNLFSKLDNFHGRCPSIDNLNCLTEDKLVFDVLDELLMFLSCQDGSECSLSLVSKVAVDHDDYTCVTSVHGEQDEPARDDDIPPWAVWSSLLEGRNPGWRLLPISCQKMRRRGEAPTTVSHYAECGNENQMATNKMPQPFRDKLPRQKSRSAKIPRTALERKDDNVAGHPNLAGTGKELLPCTDGFNGTRYVEETCTRRMRDLLLKQKKEIREFYRSKREDRAKLDEEHQLEVDLINQGCREAGAKQEELKRLGHIYEKKLEEHNCQMGLKRKELEDVQRASRIKEKQVKDKPIALSKTKILERPILSLVNESLLDFDLGPQNAESCENAVDAVAKLCDPVPSKSVPSQGISDESVEHHDHETPECSIKDTELLSLDSDGENDDEAASLPRVAVPNTIGDNDSPRLPSCTSSLSENVVGDTAQDIHPAPNREIEGDSSTNTQPCTETLQGITVENQSYRDIGGHSDILPECPVSGPLESGGENDEMIAPIGEAVGHGSNFFTSNRPGQCVLSSQSHLEQLSSSANRGADDSMEISGRPSNGEVICCGDEELDNPATVDGLQGAHEQAPTDLTSTRLASSSPVVQQSQIGTILDDSLHLEQPVVSACLPVDEVPQNVEVPAVSSFQVSESLGSCHLDQSHCQLRSSGPTMPSLRLSVQSLMGCDQTHILTAGHPTIMQSPNCYFWDTSSVRSNMVPSTGFDPLLNELKRIKREEEEAMKAHEEKTVQIKSACEKEMDEVRKKYDLLRQEADTVLLQKKVKLESVCSRLRANKSLAETLNYYHQRPPSPLVSQEALLNAIRELPLLQQRNRLAQRTATTGVTPTASQVQVVHQLSDLMSFDPVTLQNSVSPRSHGTVNFLTCHPARAPPPHLLPQYELPTTPMPSYGITSERLSQATPVRRGSGPGGSWHQQYLANASRPQPYGTPYNPVVL